MKKNIKSIGQLQAKDFFRKTGCGRKTAWVLVQEGRSQDTRRDVTRIQDTDQNTDQDKVQDV